MKIPELGDVVSSRYELTDELGRGGFGVVYKATQIGMNRPVALKVLLPQAAADDTIIDRFVREAQLAKNLVHPNTIQLYDFGETDGGCLFIAMEYLEGETLDDLIKREGQLPMDRTVHICAQILKSLAEAHEHGIVHRDLKPANIFMRELVGESDFVKVLDFGIAKALNLDGAEEEQQLTKTGSSFGTPSYMSPEQIRGLKIGPHTDLYALGLIMVKMLTGRTAVEGGTPIETAALQLSTHPIPIVDWIIQSPLGPIVQRALAKDLTIRYSLAAEMLADLANLQQSHVLAAVPSGVMTVPPGATGPTPPSGQLMYSGQIDYNQLSGPVPMPGQPQGKSIVVPMLIVIILLLLSGGAAAVYFFAIAPAGDGDAQAQTKPEASEPETTAPPATNNNSDEAIASDLADLQKAVEAGEGGEEAEGGGDTEEDEDGTSETEEQPPEVVKVDILVTSVPEGAIVREGDAILGTTPFTAKFDEGSGKHTLILSGGLDYDDLTVEVDVADPKPVEATLVAKAGTAASAGGSGDEKKSSRRERKRDRKKDDKKNDKKDDKTDKPKDDKKKPFIPLPD